MRRARLFFALALLLPRGAGARAAAGDAVKAAFLPRFARYVTWPGARVARAPARRSSSASSAATRSAPCSTRPLRPSSIDGHSVAVRRMPSADRAAGCQLAFVEGADPAGTTRLLLALRSQPILTVTDGRAGPQRGMIHFTIVGGRVRFFIDDAEAAGRGLSISSRLLALAAGVRQRR